MMKDAMQRSLMQKRMQNANPYILEHAHMYTTMR